MSDEKNKIEEGQEETVSKKDEIIVLEKKEVSEPEKPRTEQQINIGTLNIFTSPIRKYIQEPLKKRYEKHYHPSKKHGKKHLILDIILASIIIALVAFLVYIFFWYGRGITKLIDLQIKVSPFSVESGGDIIYKISYLNNSEYVLEESVLNLKFPDTFILKDAPQGFDSQTDSFKIGQIQPRGNGLTMFSGQLFGGVGENQRISVTLNYKYRKDQKTESKPKAEKKIVTTTYLIEDSVLDFNLDFPPEFFDNQEAEFGIKVKNLSLSNNLSNLILMPQWPKGFQLTESTGKFEANKGWLIDNLPANGEEVIKFKGQVNSLGEATKKFVFDSYINYHDINFWQEKKEASGAIAYPKFTFIISTNKPSIYLGELVEYAVNYQNQEDYDLADVNISVPIDGNIFNVRSVVTNGKFSDSQIIWDKSKIKDLAAIKSGQKGNLSFKIRTKSALSYRQIFKERSEIILTSQANYKIVSQEVERKVKLQGSPLAINVNSDLTITAFGRYYTAEGDQLGRGPLPPVVGRTTKYWIFLHILNNFNDVDNIKVSAKLPANVEFTGRTSVANGYELTYNSANKTVTWQVGSVKSFRSLSENSIGAAFEIAFTPSLGQVGTESVILSNITITGVDAFTGVTLESSAKPVTTNLYSDSYAVGKGVVLGE